MYTMYWGHGLFRCSGMLTFLQLQEKRSSCVQPLCISFQGGSCIPSRQPRQLPSVKVSALALHATLLTYQIRTIMQLTC